MRQQELRNRPVFLMLLAVCAMAALSWMVGPTRPAGALPTAVTDTPAVTPAEAIRQLGIVRDSIDRTLELSKTGDATEAFEEAKSGYLNHFEYVEIPLRVVAPQLTAEAETQFAVIRGLISSQAPPAEIRAEIVELRSLIDQAERQLTDTGISAPLVVMGQSFIIMFREGLEAVLLVSVLLGYLEAAKATQFRRPILGGMAAAIVATVLTFFALRAVLDAIPMGRELLEALTAILAVIMLFYVSFWLIARLEQKKWMEFLRARVWSAISVGSTIALVMVGFTAIYREGFETALFYQALLSFGEGLEVWIALGFALAVATLAVLSWVIFKLGRKVPVKAFLGTAVVVIMITSITLLGNAVRALQEADVIPLHRWPSWPKAPIFLAQTLGYWPSRETILAQAALTLVYLAGAVYIFVIRPRRSATNGPATETPTPSTTPAGS